jgi:signal transduction histidine kinase
VHPRPASLRDLRVAAVRSSATALALLGSGAAVFVWVRAGGPSPAGIAWLAGVALHTAAAATVGRRWEPDPAVVVPYLAATVALVLPAIAAADTSDPEAFWPLLVPVALGGLTLSARSETVVVAAAATTYVVTAATGPGATVPTTAARVAALGLTAWLLSELARRLEHALGSTLDARRTADERANRLEVVSRTARTLPALAPEAVLDATLLATEELGWPAAALVLTAGDDGTRLVRTRGLEPEPDPSTGIVGQVLRLGATRRPSPDDPWVREAGLATVVAAPVRIAGSVRGALLVGDRRVRRVDPTDDEAVELVAGHVGRALEVAGRLEHELARIEMLEDLGRERDDFLSTVVHELRTPLTAIIGLTETVRRHRAKLSEERREQLLARVEANARSLENIVTAMLDLSRLERGTLQVAVEALVVTDIVRRTVERLESLLSHHAVRLELPPAPVTVLADPRLIERVVENLLTNAARHTPPGTTVTVEVGLADDHAVVAVADEGPGLTPDEIEQLGRRFQRGSHVRERSGAGLGMSLVVEVLRLHDTTLVVDTDRDRGARFSFALPRPVEVEVEVDISGLDRSDDGRLAPAPRG